jgi:hypothetical protein
LGINRLKRVSLDSFVCHSRGLGENDHEKRRYTHWQVTPPFATLDFTP